MFPIYEISFDKASSYEQLGSKPKFWFLKNDGSKYLYKEARPGTGEDWAEKVACELSGLLELPYVPYDFAISNSKRGVICKDFVPDGGRLIHGNELLAVVQPGYDINKQYKARQYTLIRTFLLLSLLPKLKVPIGWQVFEGVNSAVDIFIGYLMLDAWIANQDRHHENWGVVTTKDMSLHLTPTFDHASSLGRNESDEKRALRLSSRDPRRGMTGYVERAASAFYHKSSRLTTLSAFVLAAKFSPSAAKAWLRQLQLTSSGDIRNIFEKVPTQLISEVAIEFAVEMLKLNRKRLLKVRELIL